MYFYTLSICLKFNQAEIIIYQDKKKIKKVSWQDKQDLDQKLLRELDKILKRSKIKITDLKEIKFFAAEDTSITARNIGQATIESLNFALNLF
jgi:DNA-binding LytR/AlgR family response regulator